MANQSDSDPVLSLLLKIVVIFSATILAIFAGLIAFLS